MLNLRCQSTLSFSDGFGSGRHGRPASGRTRQVVAVRRRCPRQSGCCCHDNATRPTAHLFASPAPPRLISSLRAERRAFAIAAEHAPSPCSLAFVKTLPLASSKLRCVLLDLLHLLAKPIESR